MEKILEQKIRQISEEVPQVENEYMGEDGLLHCAVCHRNTQTRVEVLGIPKVVRCVCDCDVKKRDEAKERGRQEELERQRRICFAETNMANWTFANDDRRNPKLSDAMKRYADDFANFKKDSKGLLLYGTVGTGKTYYSACIANELISKDYRVLMTSFTRLINQLQGMYEGKQRFIDNLNTYSLLIIDDLGVERNTEYMQEMVFHIIDSRYRSGLPFIVTTNLTSDELTKTQDIGSKRIYDRILERCIPVEVAGVSRRRTTLKETNAEMKARLGL